MEKFQVGKASLLAIVNRAVYGTPNLPIITVVDITNLDPKADRNFIQMIPEGYTRFASTGTGENEDTIAVFVISNLDAYDVNAANFENERVGNAIHDESIRIKFNNDKIPYLSFRLSAVFQERAYALSTVRDWRPEDYDLIVLNRFVGSPFPLVAALSPIDFPHLDLELLAPYVSKGITFTYREPINQDFRRVYMITNNGLHTYERGQVTQVINILSQDIATHPESVVKTPEMFNAMLKGLSDELTSIPTVEE